MTRAISTADIVDRVLDKGIVIEYQGRVSLGGIDTMITVDGCCVVASIETDFRKRGLLNSGDGGIVPPPLEPRLPPRRRR